MPTNSRAVVQIGRENNGTFAKGHGGHSKYFIDRRAKVKECSKCHKIKAFDDYYKASEKPIGIRSACKICVAILNEQRDQSSYYWKNKTRIQAIKRKCMYGIVDEEYQKLLKQQDNKCGACKQETKLVIDHCHNTGKIRGLLCRNCNTALGQLGDSIERVEKLLEYIKNGY